MLRRHDGNNDAGNSSALNETGSFKGKMQANKEHTYSYTVVEDIHNYAKKIAWTKRRLAKMPQGDIGIQFIDKLKLVGLSDARLCYYGDRVPRLLDEFEKIGVKLEEAKKKDCEAVLSVILSQKYKGETKVAFAMSLLRLVHFAKKDEIGDKKRGYAEEVAWISPVRYKDKNEGIQPKDLLTLSTRLQ